MDYSDVLLKLKVQTNAELYAFPVQKGNFSRRKRTTKQL